MISGTPPLGVRTPGGTPEPPKFGGFRGFWGGFTKNLRFLVFMMISSSYSCRRISLANDIFQSTLPVVVALHLWCPGLDFRPLGRPPPYILASGLTLPLHRSSYARVRRRDDVSPPMLIMCFSFSTRAKLCTTILTTTQDEPLRALIGPSALLGRGRIFLPLGA